MNHQLSICSEELNYALLIIPKCASSTLRIAFRDPEYQGKETWIQQAQKEKFAALRKYIFLRHPVDRLLSAYRTIYTRYVYQKSNEPDLRYPFLDDKDSIYNIFMFIDAIKEFGYFDPHIRPQYWYVEGFEIEGFFQVETLLSGVNEMRRRLEIKNDLTFLTPYNVSAVNGPFYYKKEELPKNLVREIQKIYSKDMELYSQYF